MKRPFSNDRIHSTQRVFSPLKTRRGNKDFSKLAQINITSPTSKARRLSRSNRIEDAIKNYKATMTQIKKMRNKEEEKSRMLNTFIPRPSYSRWVVKKEDRFERKLGFPESSMENDSESSDEGNFWNFRDFWKF